MTERDDKRQPDDKEAEIKVPETADFLTAQRQVMAVLRRWVNGRPAG